MQQMLVLNRVLRLAGSESLSFEFNVSRCPDVASDARGGGGGGGSTNNSGGVPSQSRTVVTVRTGVCPYL